MVKTIYKITCGNGHKFDGNHTDTHCHVCDEKISWQWKIETERKTDLSENELLNRVCQWLAKKDPNFTCGELQKNDADFIGQLIILADWNNLFNYEQFGKTEHNWRQVNKLTDFIENRCNALTGFDDEYTSCSSCAKIISTTPGYYGDQKNYIMTEYDILCRNCVLDDPESIIDDFKNDPGKALPDWFYPEIEKDGYVLLQSAEDSDIWVFKSPFYTIAGFCSPCAPGAVYLTDPSPDAKGYCLGPDWFESGRAPYKVFSVETGKEILP